MEEKAIKFIVRSGGKYQDPETTIENAMDAVEKIKDVHPNAEISVEVDIR